MSDRPVWSRDGRDWPNREASRFVEAGGLRWHVQVAGQGPVLQVRGAEQISSRLVWDSPGWRHEARHLPKDVTRASVIGFDLVRDELGGFRVLEDNVRVPSGVAYAIALRRLLDDVAPELPRPAVLAASPTPG